MGKITDFFKKVIAEGKIIILPSVLIAFFFICSCNESVIYTGDELQKASDYEDINVSDEENASNAAKEEKTLNAAKEEYEVPQTEEEYIVVHVCGAVQNGGVYELKSGERVMDAVLLAGGFTEDADENAVNLAKEVEDGSKIYIPTIGEEVPADELKADDTQGKVNINTANEDMLTNITGVGPSRAKAIIAYREEHGGFKSVEEITNVSGIGAASLEKMREQITVK